MVPEGITSHESRLHSPPEQVGKADFEGVKNRENQENVLPPEIQTKLSDARWNESFGNQQEELQKSEKFLVSLPEPERETIFQIIQQASRRNFDNYIKENGYIINPVTLQAFKVKFRDNSEKRKQENKEAQTEEEKIQTEEEKVQTEEEKVQEEKENNKIQVEEDLSIFNGSKEIFLSQIDKFSHIPNFHEVVQKLQNANPENPEEIKSLNEALKTALAQNFEKVAKVYEELGRQENPSNPFASTIFLSFEKQALAIDPSFSSRMESYKTAPINIESIGDTVHQAQVVAGLGTEKFEKNGNILEANLNGQVTRMDIGEVPPTRTIGLEGRSLRIDTEVPIGDFYPAIAKEGLAYEEVSRENMPKISRLKALESSQVQDFINGEEFQKESLANCIRIISSMIGLPADVKLSDLMGKEISSKEELISTLSPSLIFSRKQELEKEVQDKKVAYQKALATHMQDYSDAVRERDEMAKKALQICKNAGFDLLDIDYILSQLSGSQVPNIGVSFDKKNIDIATLNFGQPNGEAANESNFAQRIYRTMNMILFQNPNGTDANGEQVGFDLTAIARNPLGQQFDNPDEIKELLQGKKVINATGTMNKELVMQRFTQGVKTNKARYFSPGM